MRSLPTAATRLLALSVASALTDRPFTHATPMLSHRAVTVPPSELRSATPARGMEDVSLKITTVFPVGVPLIGESAVRSTPALDGAAIFVGASEHAASTATAGMTTDHRRRLVRIFL